VRTILVLYALILPGNVSTSASRTEADVLRAAAVAGNKVIEKGGSAVLAAREAARSAHDAGGSITLIKKVVVAVVTTAVIQTHGTAAEAALAAAFSIKAVGAPRHEAMIAGATAAAATTMAEDGASSEIQAAQEDNYHHVDSAATAAAHAALAVKSSGGTSRQQGEAAAAAAVAATIVDGTDKTDGKHEAENALDAVGSVSTHDKLEAMIAVEQALKTLHEQNAGHSTSKATSEGEFLMPWEYHKLTEDEEIELDALFMALCSFVVVLVLWIFSCYRRRMKFIDVKTSPAETVFTGAKIIGDTAMWSKHSDFSDPGCSLDDDTFDSPSKALDYQQIDGPYTPEHSARQRNPRDRLLDV
jgi:hypothetical protein